MLQNGNNSFVAEANDEMAVKMKSMDIKPDAVALVSLSFVATSNEKEGSVRYFQRVRIEHIVLL